MVKSQEIQGQALELAQLIALHRDGFVGDAESGYRALIASGTGEAVVYQNLAVISIQNGQRDEAFELLRQALQLDPKNPEIYLNLGVSRVDESPAEAIEYYRQAIELEPSYADAYNNMGVALQLTGKVEESVRWFERALELNPSFPKASANLFNAYKALNRLDQATSFFRKLVELHPHCAEGYSGLGVALKLQGDEQEALDCIRQSSQIDQVSQKYRNLYMLINWARSRFANLAAVTKSEFLTVLTDSCHHNIQLLLALRKEELYVELMAWFPGVNLDKGEFDSFVKDLPLSVVNQEYTWSVGRYPLDLFIKSYDDVANFVKNVIVPADSSRISKLSDSRFFCIGSCFASNVSAALQKLGADVHTTVLSENINSPRNNVDLFRYLDSGIVEGLLQSEESEVEQLAGLREKFASCNTLIMTLGCAYSLISLDTGLPMRKPVGRCGFDRPQVAKIIDYLNQIVNICLKNNYQRIFVTVSPVPLAATLIHNQNPYISDSVSKAMLRAAVDEVCQMNSMVEYVPAFEVFRQSALHSHLPTFGLTDGCSRHVDAGITGLVMDQFLKTFFVESGST